MKYDINAAISVMNKKRLANKNKWISLEIEIGDKIVLTKSFNTWTQIMICDNKKIGTLMDLSITQWKQELKGCFEFLLK